MGYQPTRRHRAHSLRTRTAIALAGAASLTSTRGRFVVVATLVCLVDHSNDKAVHYAKHVSPPLLIGAETTSDT